MSPKLITFLLFAAIGLVVTWSTPCCTVAISSTLKSVL